MSNCFDSTADQVQVNKGFAVQDTDRVTILGGAIDVALRIKRSRRHEKDRLRTDPLLNPLVDFLVDFSHRCVIDNGIGTEIVVARTKTVKYPCSVQAGANGPVAALTFPSGKNWIFREPPSQLGWLGNDPEATAVGFGR